MSDGETTRSLSSDIKTQLASGSFNMAHLVKLELDSTYYFTDSRSDVYDVSDSSSVVIATSFTDAATTITITGGTNPKTDPLSIGMLVSGTGIQAGTTIQSIASISTITISHSTTESGTPDLTFTAVLYTANGFLQAISAVTENVSTNIASMTLRISGVNQSIISDVLTNGHLHRAVSVKRAILDDSDSIIDTFMIYKGFIEGMSISDKGESSSVSFAIANHWADFQRIEGRATNNSSQQHHHAGDLGFEFADQVSKKLLWGDIDVNMLRTIDYPPPLVGTEGDYIPPDTSTYEPELGPPKDGPWLD